MKIGYARVSTQDQNLQLQLDALKKAGCDKVFTDKISSQKKERQGLLDALDYVRSEDSFVVWKLDRLCRSTKELIDISYQLEEKSVSLTSLTENIDTSSPAGRMYFTVLGAIAQMEREVIQERISAGLQSAKQRGIVLGRPQLTKDKIKAGKKLLESGMGYQEVADSMGISKSSLYKYIPANTISL